jgi:hypothetical protein
MMALKGGSASSDAGNAGSSWNGSDSGFAEAEVKLEDRLRGEVAAGELGVMKGLAGTAPLPVVGVVTEGPLLACVATTSALAAV